MCIFKRVLTLAIMLLKLEMNIFSVQSLPEIDWKNYYESMLTRWQKEFTTLNFWFEKKIKKKEIGREFNPIQSNPI